MLFTNTIEGLITVITTIIIATMIMITMIITIVIIRWTQKKSKMFIFLPLLWDFTFELVSFTSVKSSSEMDIPPVCLELLLAD